MKAIRLLDKALVVCVVALFILISSYVIYGNFLQGRPEVTVYLFNSTPYIAGEASRQILPEHKLHHRYVYRYDYNNGGLIFPKVDHEDYIEDHPNDAVLESFSQGIGLEVTVYSDNLPDEEYLVFSGDVYPTNQQVERRLP